MTTRRTLLRFATAGFGALAAGGAFPSMAADTRPLKDRVIAACRRLAPLGWRDLIMDVTGGALDLAAVSAATDFTRPLAAIDRTVPGFGDFDARATKPIEPAFPERSLLYHAFAAPSVVATRNGEELKGFPTLTEIEAIEDYVFGAVPPSFEALRARAAGHRLGLVVFATQYRNAPESVHGHHAELCFARAGIGRLGTTQPLYDAKKRNFTALDDSDPFAFRVVPRRYSAYIAMQVRGTWTNFGPQDRLGDDDKHLFWVPLHKLFSGTECIRGMTLDVRYERGLRNDEIAMFHRFLDIRGLKNNVSGPELEEFPFTIKDGKLGSFGDTDTYGTGVLVPQAQPIISVPEYKGKKLTFPVDGRYSSQPQNIQLSSLQVLPTGASDIPRYMNDASQDVQRPGPEYINIRHKVTPDGSIVNLNHEPRLIELMRAGGYDALHYIDGAGDGWVKATCAQLDGRLEDNVPAYCMIGLPDFFPKVSQRDLMQWWKNDVPKPIRAALWAIPPLALSQTRIAANITLPIGFSIDDDTVPAIVTQPRPDRGPVQKPNGPILGEKTGLPDGSPGLFDPGWDTSQGIYYSGPSPMPLQKFLAGYGLGSPFIEDAKLCAALGAYWPGVAPDSTRVFAPDKRIGGIEYPYPTIAPLTDEEIGIVPSPRYGKPMPWDGVPGPTAIGTTFRHAEYRNAWRVDYIDMVGTMTAALTARIDTAEYQARVMAMEAVYWALGIHDPDFRNDPPGTKLGRTAPEKIVAEKSKWAVLSFVALIGSDPDMLAAWRQAGRPGPAEGPFYRFHVYRWGKETPGRDMYHVRVEMLEEVHAYVAGTRVVIQRDGGGWTYDDTLPT